MTPVSVFLLRLALSLGAGLFLSVTFFGGFNWIMIIVLAGFMLGVAYVSEAFRRRGGK